MRSRPTVQDAPGDLNHYDCSSSHLCVCDVNVQQHDKHITIRHSDRCFSCELFQRTCEPAPAERAAVVPLDGPDGVKTCTVFDTPSRVEELRAQWDDNIRTDIEVLGELHMSTRIALAALSAHTHTASGMLSGRSSDGGRHDHFV